jgi:hypothetical protein
MNPKNLNKVEDLFMLKNILTKKYKLIRQTVIDEIPTISQLQELIADDNIDSDRIKTSLLDAINRWYNDIIEEITDTIVHL